MGDDDAAAIRETWRVIGGLQMAVDDLRRQWEVQDRAATNGRRILYGKVDALNSSVISMESKVTLLNGRVDAIAPVVRSGEKADLQKEGAWKLLKLLGYIIAVLVGGFGNAFLEIFHFGGPHKAP